MIIAHLHGSILKKNLEFVIVEANGIGYRVGISRLTAEQLPELRERVSLFIHHHITEVSQALFGFLSEHDQHIFELLITVKSVGPRLALAIMSGMSGIELIEHILHKDIQALSRIPGIGKKTAERMVLELQDRLEHHRMDWDLPADLPHSDLASETIAALIALGYKRAVIENLVYSILKSDEKPDTLSESIKIALRQLHA